MNPYDDSHHDETQQAPEPPGSREDESSESDEGSTGSSRPPTFDVDQDYSDDYLSDTYDSEKYRTHHNLSTGLSTACAEFYDLYPDYARLRSLDLTLVRIGDLIGLVKHLQTVTIVGVVQERIRFRVRNAANQETTASKGALLVPDRVLLAPGVEATLITKNLTVTLVEDPGDGMVTIELPSGEQILSARSALIPLDKLAQGVSHQELAAIYTHCRTKVSADNPGYQELAFYLLFCEYFQADSVQMLDALPMDVYELVMDQLRKKAGSRPISSRTDRGGAPDRLF